MRRPVVVLVLLAILGLFACCAAAGGNSWWKKLSTNSRKDQPEGSNTQSSNPPETPYYPDMSNIPQTTEAEHTYPIYYEPDPINVAATHSTFRDIVQQHTGQHRSTNFDQSHYPQHDSPYYPDMSNIPQSTNFNQSHHPYPDMSNIPQSTNFTQHASHYDQGMSSTIQPKTNKPKRSRESKKPSTTYIPTDPTNFLQLVQQQTAKPKHSTTTAGGGSTQWTNPAGLNQSQYDLAPLPGYEQFPAMSQNFQSQQPDGGWFNSVSNLFKPKHPKH